MNIKLLKLVLVFAFIVQVLTLHGQNEKQPNIVILLADDLGWVDISCDKTNMDNGSNYHQTPNIDKLAEQGVSFTGMYACQNCAPSRAALLSGEYAPRTGMYNVNSLDRGDKNSLIKPIEQNTALRPDLVTLAEELKKSGYITAHFGKWHLGPMQEIETINGFDYSYSADGEEFKNLKGKTNHFFAEQNQAGEWRFNMYGDRLSRFAQPYSEDYIEKYLQPYANGNNPETLKGTPKHINEALADATQDFLANKRVELGSQDKPFFMYVAFHLVHVPVHPRQDLVEKYRNIESKDPRHTNVEYAAFVEQLDQVVARILDQFKDPNGDGDYKDDVSDNTVIFFLSDNGAPNNSRGKGISNNKPLRGYKGMQYDGGTRVPLIVCWPDHIKAGRINNEAIHVVDLYPTICDLAQVDKTALNNYTLDGESITPVLLGQSDSLKRKSIFFHFPGYLDTRSKPSTIIIEDFGADRFKLLYDYESMNYELYQLSNDISESDNLLEDNPSKSTLRIAEKMSQNMVLWLKDLKPAQMTYRQTNQLVPLPVKLNNL